MAAFNAAYENQCADSENRDGCAAQIAWAAVKRSFTKNESGDWVKSENCIQAGNTIPIEPEWSPPLGIRTAILQRLDSCIKSNGMCDIYDLNSFKESINRWAGVPVIFTDVTSKSDDIAHPDFSDVVNGTLPDQYRVVGKIERAWIPESGEPVLAAEIGITDDSIEKLLDSGSLSLSTGFVAGISKENGSRRVGGTIIPNHVLVFRRGACRTCFPNDNTARFLNVMHMEEEHDAHEVQTAQKIVELVKNALNGLWIEKREPPDGGEEAAKETVNMTDIIETDEYKNVLEEKAAIERELAEIKNRIEEEKRQREWEIVKNTVPEGWLGEKERETRELFENNPAEFVRRLGEHFNTTPREAEPEGDTVGIDVTEIENSIPAGTIPLGKYDHITGEWVREDR